MGFNRSSETFIFHPFKDLRKKIENNKGKRNTNNNKKNLPFPPFSKGEEGEFHGQMKDIFPNDEELFINAMKDVREIKEFRKIPVYQKKPVSLFKHNSSDHEALIALEEIVRGKRPVNLPDTQEYVEWVNKNYRGDITREVHEGKYSVQDILDLHGVTVEEAASEVERFLNNSLKKGYRCIKVIHGRGLRSSKGSVLKDAVVKLLSVRFRKHIIAFVTARQCDGGLGALYVVLK